MSAQILNYMPPVDVLLTRIGQSVDLLREVPHQRLNDIEVIHEATGLHLSGYMAIRHLAAMLDNLADNMVVERVKNDVQA